MKGKQLKNQITRAGAGILIAICLTSCMGGIADIPFEDTFPWEMPEEEGEQPEITPDTPVEPEQDMQETSKEEIKPVVLPKYDQVHAIDLPMVWESPANVKKVTVSRVGASPYYVYTFYKDSILVQRYTNYEWGYYRSKEWFFCPYDYKYYGYVRHCGSADTDFSEYEVLWMFENYDEVIACLLNDMSGEYPTLARIAGVDQNAVYQASYDYYVEYSAYSRDFLYADVYEVNAPTYGRILYFANPDTHFLERVLFLKDEMHGCYPPEWEKLFTEEEKERFLAEGEIRDVLPADWKEWTARELIYASELVVNWRFEYANALEGIVNSEHQIQLKEWNYRMKQLRRLPKG